MFIRRQGSPVGIQGIQGSLCRSAPRGSSSARKASPPVSRAEGGIVAFSLLLAGTLLVTPALADEATPEIAPLTLEPVVVVSTRSPRPVSEVVGMVSVLDDADIESRLVMQDEDLWRYLPGIQVESSGTRFGSRSLSIRGVGGNRVVMELDGIPVQERFSVGQFGFAGRTGADVDFIRHVEVLRGPASSLYGSKAIGGVVAVSTFDPEDLAGGPHGRGGLLRAGYASDWDSPGAAALGAWHGEAVGLLLGLSHRQGHESDRSADPANPDRLDLDRTAILAKVTLADNAGGRLRLTLDGDREDTASEMNSLVGQGRFANTTALAGDDRMTRTGVALDGRLDGETVMLEGVVFHRETETRQDTVDLRDLLAPPVRIDRTFRYDTRTSGVRGQVSRELQHGAFRHRLMLGAAYSEDRLEESRDASQTGLLDGAVSKVVLGERFPLRDFPVTENQETGVFLQDEIDSVAGHWTLIPSLRYDRTRISVRDDEAWRLANPSADLAEQTVSDVSPRLGVLWRPSRGLQAWGQVTSGFRAPPAEDLNIGLDIPLFRIRALPNPELKSESSIGWEAGLRANAGGAWLSAAAFWTDYEDFIVSLVPLGPDPDTGTLLFQSQNLDRARIRGVEFEAGLPLGLLTPKLEAFAAGFSGYWAEGEDRRTGQDLADVGPPAAVLYLDWADASGEWEARLSGSFARSQQPGEAADAAFEVPGYGVLDLTFGWRATERLTLRAGVFNLGDKTWWRWGDVRRIPADDPLIPALSAPGRSVSVSFNLGLGPGRS
jgi:hemoglobin/transferrin/lactoferrin receptor protein